MQLVQSDWPPKTISMCRLEAGFFVSFQYLY